MSSMTIDQLKKSLTEQGITLPPSRSKKADYVKLYKQYSSINDSLGDIYSSDDENPPRSGSQIVTSSSSPSKSENIAREVELMSDEDLYLRLKEFDDKIGPVLKNTRRVYEKKLIKMLTGGKQTNGYESVKTQMEKFTPSVDEFSDSDVEFITESIKRAEGRGRKSSVLRDSPKPSFPESSSKPDLERPFTSNYEFSNRSSTPGLSNEIKSSRFSYIETIPKGSSYSYIEPDADVGFGSSDLRQRYPDKYDADKFSSDKFISDRFGSDKYMTSKSSADEVYKPSIGIRDQYKPGLSSQFKAGPASGDHYKSGFGTSGQYKSSLGTSSQFKSGGFGEQYTGTWEPNINRYMGTATGKKIATQSKGLSVSSWLKNLLAIFLLFAILILVFYIYHQWSTTDPYKMIEDDVEKKLQELDGGSGN